MQGPYPWKKIIILGVIGTLICNLLVFAICNSVNWLLVHRFIETPFVFAVVSNILWIGLFLVGSFLLIYLEHQTISGLSLYSILILSGVSFCFLAGALTHGEAIRTMLEQDRADSFMDFFNSVQYGLEPYTNRVIYPPLINVVYAFLGQFFKLQKDILTSAYYLREQQVGIVLYSLLAFFTQLGILGCIWYLLRAYSVRLRVLFSVALTASLPFVFLLERGNAVHLTLFFCFLFLCLYRQESRWLVVLSYFCLGVAIGIKIAPGVFLLLFLRDRRWRDFFQATGIATILFFLPFLFLDGGPGKLLSNIAYTSSLFAGAHIRPNGIMQMQGNGEFVNLWNTFDCFGRLINHNLWNASKITTGLLFLVGCVEVVLHKEMAEWKAVAILSSFLILLPGISAIYNLTYLAMPLVLFFRERRMEIKNINACYFVLFVCVFLPIINFRLQMFSYAFADTYPVRLSTIVEGVSCVLLLGVLEIEAVWKCSARIVRYGVGAACLLTVVYGGYLVCLPHPVEAFQPSEMSIVNASNGVYMVHGRNAGIFSGGEVLLRTAQLRKEGLLISSETGSPVNRLKVYLNDTFVAERDVSTENHWYLYFPPEEIAEELEDDAVSVRLVAEDESAIPLVYIGHAELEDEVSGKSYLPKMSRGFWRKFGEERIRMSEEGQLLLSGEAAREGLVLQYEVPEELILQNQGQKLSLTLSQNGKWIETVPIVTPGKHQVLLQAGDFGMDGTAIPNAVTLDLSVNGVYQENLGGISDDEHPQSIHLISVAPCEAVDDWEALYSYLYKDDPLRRRKKFVMPLDSLRENGFSLNYVSGKLTPSEKGVVELYLNGEKIAESALPRDGKKHLVAMRISPDVFKHIPGEIGLFELRAVHTGEWVAPDMEDESLMPFLTVRYAGADLSDGILEVYRDVGKDEKKEYENERMEAYSAGFYQDEKDKRFYMGSDAEILFPGWQVNQRDLVLSYDVPKYLLEETGVTLTVSMNGHDVAEVPLAEAGTTETVIPYENIAPWLLGTSATIHLHVNHTFNPARSLIVGISGGEKSLAFQKIYLQGR